MFEFCHRRSSLSACLHLRGLDSTKTVGASLRFSEGIWPPSRGQERKEPLASFSYCGFLPLSEVDKSI